MRPGPRAVSDCLVEIQPWSRPLSPELFEVTSITYVLLATYSLAPDLTYSLPPDLTYSLPPDLTLAWKH